MSQGVITDASVALSWVLPGEASERTLSLRDRAVRELSLRLLVPPLFWCEVPNALWVAVNRGRLDQHQATAALETLLDFRFEVHMPDPIGCLSTALRHSITAYDASYLQLAIETQSALWTLDGRQAAAAIEAGVATAPALSPPWQ